MKKILITCPPVIGIKEYVIEKYQTETLMFSFPDFKQTMSEKELIDILPDHDGWIIGDDITNNKIFDNAYQGKLRAAVKWGIGIDNIDFKSCNELGISITNTPNMFGDEVADLALSYIISLARNTFYIDRKIRNNEWPKSQGVSLKNKTVGLVGYGDIGSSLHKRLEVLGMNTIVYDPAIKSINHEFTQLKIWPNNINECDFLVFTCSLNDNNKKMFNKDVIEKCKNGVRIINVARGGLINEKDLISALKSEKIYGAALDVFENEPLEAKSYLRDHPYCILGSHNASNTIEAVLKTTDIALNKLMLFLNVK